MTFFRNATNENVKNNASSHLGCYSHKAPKGDSCLLCVDTTLVHTSCVPFLCLNDSEVSFKCKQKKINLLKMVSGELLLKTTLKDYKKQKKV